MADILIDYVKVIPEADSSWVKNTWEARLNTDKERKIRIEKEVDDNILHTKAGDEVPVKIISVEAKM